MPESEAERHARRLLREAQSDYDQAWRLANAPHAPGAPPPEEAEALVREASARLREAARALRDARRRGEG